MKELLQFNYNISKNKRMFTACAVEETYSSLEHLEIEELVHKGYVGYLMKVNNTLLI